MWSLITSIPAIIKLLSEVLGLIKQVRMAFQKDPVEELRKDEAKQKEAEKQAGQADNTDGIFGGSK